MPHGETSCVMLPHVLDYNLEVNRSRQNVLAEAMGEPNRPLADSVKDLVSSLSLPTRLRDAGVKKDLLTTIAEESMLDHWIATNPRPISGASTIFELLEKAW